MEQINWQTVLYIVLAAGLGFVWGWLWSRLRTLKLFKEKVEKLQTDIQEAERARDTLSNERSVYFAKATRLESELAASQSVLRGREASLAEKNAKLKEQEGLLERIAEKDGELTRLRWRLSELEQRYGSSGNLPVRKGPTLPYENDDLRLIRGIGRVSVDLLNRMNINTFRQMAQWTETDLKRISELLREPPERIRGADWMGQAKEQHLLKYGEKL